METKTRFKVLLYPRAGGNAATTKTFDSKKEAEEYIKGHGTGWQSEIIEVDANGRPTHERMVGLASPVSVGGIEKYVCTHCQFESDLPGVAHDCAKCGRDDSFTLEPTAKTDGQLTAMLIQRPGLPKEYVVDWVADDTHEKWRALLQEDELRRLREINKWRGEVKTLESFGVLGAITFEMDAATLRKFAFRHLRAR